MHNGGNRGCDLASPQTVNPLSRGVHTRATDETRLKPGVREEVEMSRLDDLIAARDRDLQAKRALEGIRSRLI
jgi:hypothetical protein